MELTKVSFMHLIASQIILFMLLIFPILLFGQHYEIDPGHSNVQVRVERFGGVEVVGRFKGMEGEIHFSEGVKENIKAKVVIDAGTYDANNSKGEASFKGKAFLDVETYPKISFVSREIVIEGDEMLIIGDLNLHGVTREVKFPFKLKGPNMDIAARSPSIAIEAQLVLNRHDYGITFDKKLSDGTSFVGDQVKIFLMIHAIQKKDSPQ